MAEDAPPLAVGGEPVRLGAAVAALSSLGTAVVGRMQVAELVGSNSATSSAVVGTRAGHDLVVGPSATSRLPAGSGPGACDAAMRAVGAPLPASRVSYQSVGRPLHAQIVVGRILF